EQWDLLTIALKLPRVIDLLADRFKKVPTEIELSKETGLNRGIIRRCKLLMNLPQEYKDLILDELKKPKAQQKITEDFFIEMEKSLITVQRAIPNLIADKDAVRKVLIQKYKENVIKNLVDLRNVGKIARATDIKPDKKTPEQALTELFTQNKYSIEQAF